MVDWSILSAYVCYMQSRFPDRFGSVGGSDGSVLRGSSATKEFGVHCFYFDGELRLSAEWHRGNGRKGFASSHHIFFWCCPFQIRVAAGYTGAFLSSSRPAARHFGPCAQAGTER